MTTISTPIASDTAVATRLSRPRLSAAVCLLGAAAAPAAFFTLGIGARGGTGGDVTARLAESAARFQLVSVIAIYGAVALAVAAVLLGRRIGQDAGRAVTLAGGALAVLFAAYYSTYAAGASVVNLVLDEAGPGAGEATLVLLNLVELTRYAPLLLLLAAVLVARRRLPRSLTIPAWLLLLLTVVPVTTWIAALLAPVWLGVAGALSVRR